MRGRDRSQPVYNVCMGTAILVPTRLTVKTSVEVPMNADSALVGSGLKLAPEMFLSTITARYEPEGCNEANGAREKEQINFRKNISRYISQQ